MAGVTCLQKDGTLSTQQTTARPHMKAEVSLTTCPEDQPLLCTSQPGRRQWRVARVDSQTALQEQGRQLE